MTVHDLKAASGREAETRCGRTIKVPLTERIGAHATIHHDRVTCPECLALRPWR